MFEDLGCRIPLNVCAFFAVGGTAQAHKKHVFAGVSAKNSAGLCVCGTRKTKQGDLIRDAPAPRLII